MGKRLAPKEGGSRFWLVVILCALAALILIGVGLSYFWNFLEAYEVSRPRNTVNSYMEDLSAQHILDLAGEELVRQVDGRVMDRETCRAEALTALEGEYTCAKNLSRSTEEKQVYALRAGSRVIGSFWMEQVGEPQWDFIPWAVTGEEFDLSFLLSEPVSVIAPEEYTVYVNGSPLPRACVVEEYPYPQLADIADSYDLPVMVRYETGPLLGPTTVTLTDSLGRNVDPAADTGTFLENCADEERAELEETVRTFVTTYVNYSTRNESDLDVGLAALQRLMIPGGALAKRMKNAQEGFEWIPAHQTAEVADLRIDLITRLSEGLYFCDVTFTVNLHNNYNNPQTVTTAKMVFRQTDNGLLAESMIIL